jgi:uncharacterized membrane protein
MVGKAGPVELAVSFAIMVAAIWLLALVRRHEPNPRLARLLTLLVYVTAAFAINAQLQPLLARISE